MSKSEPIQTAGLAASAGSGGVPLLEYRRVPTRVVMESGTGGAWRVELPVTSGARRAHARAGLRSSASRAAAVVAWWTLLLVVGQWSVGASPGRDIPLTVGLAVALFVVGTVAFGGVALWNSVLALRPVTVDVDERGRLTIVGGKRRSNSFGRPLIGAVTVTAIGRSRYGQLRLLDYRYKTLANIWAAPEADLQVVAAEMRVALERSSEMRAPIDVAPPMPPAALLGEP